MLYDRGLMAIASSPLFEFPKSAKRRLLPVEMDLPLIYVICELNIKSIHGIKAIRILHPIGPIWRRQSGIVHINIIKPHRRPVHDIDAPQGTLRHSNWRRREVVSRRRPYKPHTCTRFSKLTMLHHHVGDIPPHKGHGPARLRDGFLGVVPAIS